MPLIVHYEYARNYLFTALGSAPDVYEDLLSGLTDDEADIRPDPARFTIREAMAHVTQWESVLLSRMALTQSESEPTLPLFDETPLLGAYASSDPFEQLAIFHKRRAETVAFLESRAPEDWDRTAQRQMVGPMTIEAQALLIPLHDTYHFGQIAAWRKSFGPCCQG